MKLALLTLTFVGTLAQAHESTPISPEVRKSPVAHAGIQAIFELKEVEPDSKLIGFAAAAADPEAPVTLFTVTAEDTATKETYGCHYHGQDLHCQSRSAKSTFSHPAPPIKYSNEEFQTAAVEVISFFESRIGDPEMIQTFKLWQAAGNLEAALKWTSGQGEKIAYFMCHYHGKHIDCHRQSRVGPGEPRE